MRICRTPYVLLALNLVFLAILVGCGGGSSSSNNPPPPPPTLTLIDVSQPNSSTDVGTTEQFTATGVYSDGSTKNINSLVTWSSSVTTVATVDPTTGVAKALSSGSANITATMTAGTLSGSVTLKVNPPTSILVSPAVPGVTLGGSLPMTATGSFADGKVLDLTNFVVWTFAPTSVAAINGSGVVTGVSKGTGSVTAKNSSVSGTTFLNVTDKNFSNASLNGSYVLALDAFSSNRPTFEVGSLVADGNGHIVSGVEDINGLTVSTSVALSGSYFIYADGRGSMTLTGGGRTRTFRILLKSNSISPGDVAAQVVQSDLQANMVGRLEKQDTSAFSNGAFANSTFVYRTGGIDSASQNRTAIGLFTLDAQGQVFGGTQDLNDFGTISNSSVNGTLGVPDSVTGRAAVALAGSNYAAYIVSASRVRMVQIDNSLPAVAGLAELQTATAPPASGGYAFVVETGATTGRAWLQGQFDFNGTTVSDGMQIQAGGTFLTVLPTGNAFTFSSNGRGVFVENTMASDGTTAFRNFIAYVVSPQQMFLFQSNDSHAASGTADLQQPPSGGFSSSSFSGDYSFQAAEIGETGVTFVIQLTADGNGNFFGLEDISQPGRTNSLPVSGTYTVGPNGVASVTVGTSGAGVTSMVLYLATPGKTYVLGTNPLPGVNGIGELQ